MLDSRYGAMIHGALKSRTVSDYDIVYESNYAEAEENIQNAAAFYKAVQSLIEARLEAEPAHDEDNGHDVESGYDEKTQEDEDGLEI